MHQGGRAGAFFVLVGGEAYETQVNLSARGAREEVRERKTIEKRQERRERREKKEKRKERAGETRTQLEVL